MSTTGRKACTSGQPCHPTTLGEVLYCVVHHSRIDAKTIAERLGIKYTYLVDAANPDRDEAQFQARLIVPVTLVTGNDALLQYIASRCNGVFFPMPNVDGSHADVLEQTAKAVREFGDVLTSSAQALADNRVTVEEAGAVGRQVDEAIAALAGYKRLMYGKAGVLEPTRSSEGHLHALEDRLRREPRREALR